MHCYVGGEVKARQQGEEGVGIGGKAGFTLTRKRSAVQIRTRLPLLLFDSTFWNSARPDAIGARGKHILPRTGPAECGAG